MVASQYFLTCGLTATGYAIITRYTGIRDRTFSTQPPSATVMKKPLYFIRLSDYRSLGPGAAGLSAEIFNPLDGLLFYPLDGLLGLRTLIH